MDPTEEDLNAFKRTEDARRERFFERSQEMVPDITKEMCFYDPREVLTAIQENEAVQKWKKFILEEYEPKPNEYALLFPDTERKPWVRGETKDRAYKNLYLSLKTLKLQDRVTVFTLSDLLGIIPSEEYGSMPLYDVTGNYRWAVRQRGLNFDGEAFRMSLDLLGDIVSEFVNKHQGQFEQWHAFYRTPSIQERVINHAMDTNPFKLHIHVVKKPIASSYTLVKNSLKDMV